MFFGTSFLEAFLSDLGWILTPFWEGFDSKFEKKVAKNGDEILSRIFGRKKGLGEPMSGGCLMDV